MEKWRKGTKGKKLKRRQNIDGEEGEKEKGGAENGLITLVICIKSEKLFPLLTIY